jgi:hypothetical protein
LHAEEATQRQLWAEQAAENSAINHTRN